MNKMHTLVKKKMSGFSFKGTLRAFNGFISSMNPFTRKRRTRERSSSEDRERLKLGPTEVWKGLVSHHEDIFVSHVIPKLNQTDRWFFARASKESRDLLVRAGVDVTKFSWYELSSVSTLNYCWDHFPFGKKTRFGQKMDKSYFLRNAARPKKLELLRWAREEKKCEWSKGFCQYLVAGYYDVEEHVKLLRYCCDNGCPLDKGTCSVAAQFGDIKLLRYLLDEKRLPYEDHPDMWDWMGYAAESNHVEVMKYLVWEKDCSWWTIRNGVERAIKQDLVEAVQFLVEEADAPHEWQFIAQAKAFRNYSCLNYLRKKGFPEPTEEQYNSYRNAFHDPDGDLADYWEC